MDENSQWYYTDSNGQQAGPVGTKEIKLLIAQRAVSDHSMVWTEGMQDWAMLNQVAPLAQLPVSTVPQPTALVQPNTAIAQSESFTGASPAVVNPYAPPSAVEPTHPDFEVGAFENVMDYEGIGRLSFFLQSILYVIVGIIGIYVGIALESWAVALIAGLAMVVILIRISALRLKNMGSSAWWLLLFFVPIGGTILQIMLQACPVGYSDHKKMDTSGVIVAVVLILLNILSFSSNF